MGKNIKKVWMIGFLILGMSLIILGVSFAFWTLQAQGSKRHIIKAADMDVELIEDSHGITISDAYPVYNEVGMIGTPYTFRLVNKGGIPTTYILKLKDITESDRKLATSDVKYGLTRNGVNKIKLLSTLPSDGRIDFNILKSGETIEYALRLWVREDITDSMLTEGKTLSYRVEVELTDEKKLSLSRMKPGSYVAYTGSNGCKLNGAATTGTGNAESANSCLGYNANGNGRSGGWCDNTSEVFNVSGWRIAYTEGDRAYLISAGSPECINLTPSGANVTQINNLNTRARKYCNPNFVDGNCSDNRDTWAINNTDYNKITKQITGTGGGYVYTPAISGAIQCSSIINHGKTQCGNGNSLIDNGGRYWFAAAVDTKSTSSSYKGAPYWRGGSTKLISHTDYNYYSGGVRPIIRLSSSVYITEGSGTVDDPYIIANEIN